MRLVPSEWLTGPTRSGMYSSSNATLPRIKKKPNSVTRLGAIHSGRSSTKPFHCSLRQVTLRSRRVGWEAYVVLEDVSRYEGLVDARVFVRAEMLQRVVGYAFVLRRVCIHPSKSAYIPPSKKHATWHGIPLLGGMLGWVTGGGRDMVQRGLGLIYVGAFVGPYRWKMALGWGNRRRSRLLFVDMGINEINAPASRLRGRRLVNLLNRRICRLGWLLLARSRRLP
jgi:hypothetical protein